ncbi:MAG: CHASE2 domain-containing protein [Vicinamibacteria bacterium]
MPVSDEGSHLFDEGLIARRRLRKWATGVVVGLVVLRMGAEFAPILRRPDLVLLDFWQALRGTRTPSAQVVIVAVDEKSIRHFGPPAWPRSEYVPLVDRLAKAGAKVIGFDFTFGALEREGANNHLFAEAMKKAGNVVFGYEFTQVGDPSPPGTRPSAVMEKNGLQAGALARLESWVIPPSPSLIEPEPALAEAAAAIGHVRTVASEDGRIRVLPLVVQHGDRVYPSLGLQVARVFSGVPLTGIGLGNGVITMGEWDIPVSASGEVLLNWPADGERAFPRYSFLDVVRGDVPDEAFRGKAVFVAGTADGLDDRAFPFAGKAPGVLIYATFLDNVFRFDFAQAPIWAWLLEWGFFFVVCGLNVWLLPRLSTRLLLVGVPVLALLVMGGAGFLLVQKGIWIKAFYLILALVVPLGFMVVLRLTASERETRDVAAEKLESQKLLGIGFQEKGLLDMALATFGKLPLTDDMKLVYVNLGLDYENRAQRDKALIVYKKIFDVDPTFEDVARRMERLAQASVGTSVIAAPAPSLGEAPTLAQPTGSDLGERTPEYDAVTDMSPAGPPVPSAAAEVDSHTPTQALPATSPRHPIATPFAGGTPRPSGGPVLTPSAGSFGAPTGGPVGAPTTPGSQLQPGAVFGRYEVERHLGRGGMGDVYLVHDTVIQRRAALKTIRVDAELDPRQVIEMRQRFYREGQTAGALTHPNIVTVFDLGEALGMSYIVMEYVEGDSLAQLMKKQRLSLAQTRHVIYHAGMGLDYAHQKGVFHRDVKPDNIMVSKTGIVKVMDFGIARIVESTLTRTGSVMGTPAYMSPEQINGEKIDGRSDVFSLGVILYELLTGKKPFSGETISSLMFAIIKADPAQPSQLDIKIHTTWDEILGKALAKERGDRYATAAEFVRAVKDAPVS